MTQIHQVSIEDVLTWADMAAEKGLVSADTVRQQKTALRSLVQVLQPEEPRTAAEVFENLEDLGKRLSNKNPKGARTVATYITKARALLETHRTYAADPVHFKPKVRGRGGGGDGVARKKAKREGSVQDATAQAAPTEPPPPQAPSSPAISSGGLGELRRMPLPEGREFAFHLPRQKFTMNDVQRIACHLLTLSDDFDPTSSMPFALPPRSMPS